MGGQEGDNRGASSIGRAMWIRPWLLAIVSVVTVIALASYGVWSLDQNYLRATFGGITMFAVLLVALLLIVLSRYQRLSDQLKAKMEERTRRLESEHAQLRAILDNMSDGLVAVDTRGRIILMNAAAERMFGWAFAEVVGERFVRIVALRDRTGRPVSDARRPLSQALVGRVVNMWDVSKARHYVRRDGSAFPATVTSAPVRLGAKIMGAVAVIHDARNELEADQTKSEFITLASHQLRTPLNAVLWYAQNMLDGKVGHLTRSQQGHIADIEFSTRRMIRLVDDLLRVSQIELDRLVPDLKKVPVGELVRKTVDDAVAAGTTKKIRIQLSVPTTVPDVLVDVQFVQRSLACLLSNAILYSAVGGAVAVRVARADGSVRISVKDDGIGIPRSEHHRVFERFFRASNVRSRAVEGTGLGLYIAKRLVELSGGTIGFTSAEGKGSAFWIMLPVAKK